MLKRTLALQFVPIIIISVLSPFFSLDELKAIFTGFLLSFLFVFSSIFLIARFWKIDSKFFVKVYFIALFIRFAFVLSSFVIVLIFTKNPQILFTVSFIISYLFQSVTEYIFINQFLQKEVST